MKRISLAFLWGVAIIPFAAAAYFSPSSQARVLSPSKVGKAIAFKCQDSEANIRGKGVVGVQNGSRSIYVGYQQVSRTNKNPIVARFDNGRLTWCRTDLEVTNDDSTGYGVYWDGKDTLFAVFSATGTQGTASQDFRRFAVGGWMNGYGVGGGAKVAIIARINPNTGTPSSATFLSGVLPTGKSNSVGVSALSWNGSRLLVSSDTYSFPRNIVRKGMVCTVRSPYKQSMEFNGTMSIALSSKATHCR